MMEKSLNMDGVTWNVAFKGEGAPTPERFVYIDDASSGPFYCIGCAAKNNERVEMIPVRGPIRTNHFRHKLEHHTCSAESALHLNKKYEIYNILKKLGRVAVEKQVPGTRFIADVLFEEQWAFEVVVTNLPSTEKTQALQEKMLVFDFRDGNWIISRTEDAYCGKSLEYIVRDIAQSILEGTTVNACETCRSVKGEYSRIKAHGIRPTCFWKEICKDNKYLS